MMNSYLCTITFLAIMGLLTSSEMIQHHACSLEKHCYHESRTLLAAAEEISALSQIEELRRYKNPEKTDNPTKKNEEPQLEPTKSSPKYVKALGVNMARPPNNSRLNLYTLLHKEAPKNLPKEFSLYEVTARLMRDLYSHEPFFQQIHGCEYRILDKLIEHKEQTIDFTTPDQLSTLNFKDETVQNAFYHMVKGTKNATSLLHYITFDKIESITQSRKINLLFADSRIIHAIFPEGNTATQLLIRRAQILDAIECQEASRLHLSTDICKGRSDLSKDLKQALEEVLSQAGFNAKKYESQVFDYGLGKPGTILFIENSKTHIVIREKYIPGNHISKKKDS